MLLYINIKAQYRRVAKFLSVTRSPPSPASSHSSRVTIQRKDKLGSIAPAYTHRRSRQLNRTKSHFTSTVTAMLSTLALALFVSLSPLLPLASAQQTRCQYYPLRNAADLLLESLAFGDPDPSFAFSPNSTFLQNGKPTTLSLSILSIRHKISNDVTLIDQDGCAIYTEVISAEGENKGVFGVQARFGFTESEAGGVGLQAERIEILMVGGGTSVQNKEFDATKVLGYMEGENWEEIVQTERTGREVLIGAVQAYLDWYAGKKEIESVPLAKPCSRLEGTMYSSDVCSMVTNGEVGQSYAMTEKRYVADEVLGGVNVMFEGSRTVESFMFRVQDGKLRHVHHFVAAKAV